MERPILFSHPIDENQVNNLNNSLQSIWYITNGRQNLDIVTTTKTNADNGDIWIIATGNVSRIQFKSGGHIYTITPDGW